MTSSLVVPLPDLSLLATGASVIAFSPRHEVNLNDELELSAGRIRNDSELRPGWGPGPHEGTNEKLIALVMGIQPASSLSADAASSFLTSVPEGDLLILRVYRGSQPVLEDGEFEERRAEVEADFR